MFDLLDPASALYFGQFILRLQRHFTGVKEGSKDRRTRDFCWRLDHVNDGCPSRTHDDRSPRVERWLRDLGNSEYAILFPTQPLSVFEAIYPSSFSLTINLHA